MEAIIVTLTILSPLSPHTHRYLSKPLIFLDVLQHLLMTFFKILTIKKVLLHTQESGVTLGGGGVRSGAPGLKIFSEDPLDPWTKSSCVHLQKLNFLLRRYTLVGMS